MSRNFLHRGSLSDLSQCTPKETIAAFCCPAASPTWNVLSENSFRTF
jgi:hypothetical protein